MTGDLGSEGGRERSRPTFLPPVDGYPPHPETAWEPAPEQPGARRHRTAWTLATIAAAAVLLVSAFLPWAHAQILVQLFDQPIGRDLGTLAGIDADDLVLAVPVLAVIAIGLAFWDLVGRDARIGPLAAIPGMLSLLVCGIFVVRLGDVRDNLPQTGLDFGYEISVRYGWYIAVITSLLVTAFSLARTIAERTSRTPQGRYDTDVPQPEQHPADQQYPDQQYPDQQYPGGRGHEAGPPAAWPREDQAWGRRPEEETPREADEPGRSQS